ncbi:MAG: rod shape-determining protein MreC [Sedimentisphaerales bacterium]
MAWKQMIVGISGNDTNKRGFISRRMLFTWLMLASSIFYLAPQNFSNKFQLAFAHIFSFPLSMGSNMSLSSSTQQRLDDTVPRKKYEELQNRYANLDKTLREQRLEFNRLYGLYNSYIGKNVEFILGNIIPATADRQRNELTIRLRGTSGLAIGQFVMARNNSIIGRIADILPQTGYAKVQLITNPDSKTPVKIDGLETNWMMQGNGDGTARILNVSTEVKIQNGQQVFILDPPVIIGTITTLDKDYNAPLLWNVTVTPAWKLKELDEVAVIIMKPPG